LDDERALRYYNIRKECTVYLALRLKGGKR
jgi:ubiquitin C